jgi:ADP-ribose pyrophosphatase
MSEEIIKSEYLYRGKALNVRLDQVRATNDSKPRAVAREIIEHRGAVAVVAIDSQDRVLLVRQYRSAAQRSLLEIPAGTLEAGEDRPLRVRELKEETGYSAAEWSEIGKLLPSPGYCTKKCTSILRRVSLQRRIPEDDEAIQVETIPFADAISKIDRGEIIDAKSIVALMRVWKQRTEQRA